MKIKNLDGENFYAAFKHGAKLVEKNKQMLNEINFFPVPDSDTGNNMTATLVTAASKMKPETSIYNIFKSISDYTIQSARGNSGLIMAQFFNGFFRKMMKKNTLTTRDFALNVKKTVPYLYENIDNPHEGTMLTVIKDWANKLPELAENIDDFVLLFEISLNTARKSLNQTRKELEVHIEKDSVDAGALGFVFFLEGILSYWSSQSQHQENGENKPGLKTYQHQKEKQDDFTEISGDEMAGNISNRYCTEVFLEKESQSRKLDLKSTLKDEGDSLVIAETDDKIRVHIHTDNPARVVYKLSKVGKILEQKADDMRRQYQMAHDRMSDIALVTDSIADLPLELKDRYQIHTIPLNLMIDGVNFYDKRTIDLEHFFKYLDEAEEFPSSSQPSLDLVINYLEELTNYYSQILIISVAENLSGTGRVFKQAIKKIQENEEDRENQEDQENMQDQENQENLQDQENKEIQENQEDRDNQAIQDNQEVQDNRPDLENHDNRDNLPDHKNHEYRNESETQADQKGRSESESKVDQENQKTTFSYIDSKLNSGAQGLLVLKAAEEIAKGKSLEEVTELVEDLKSKASIYVNVNTFDYMVKGGRVSPMKGFFARLFNLKPIVSLDEEGQGAIKGKALSHRGVSKKIKELAREANKEAGVEKYALVHSKAPELVPEWKSDMQEIFGFQPEYVMEISAITALNAGPGSIALCMLTS